MCKRKVRVMIDGGDSSYFTTVKKGTRVYMSGGHSYITGRDEGGLLTKLIEKNKRKKYGIPYEELINKYIDDHFLEKRCGNKVYNNESAEKEFLELNIDKKNCYKYDPFGLCTVVDCLKCENCTFEIHGEDYSMEESKENEIYILEFLEGIPNEEEMLGYLLSEESNYRIIRYSDNEIMRYSKEEKVKILGPKPDKR